MDDLERWHQDSRCKWAASKADMSPNGYFNNGYPNNENIMVGLPPCTAEEIMKHGYPSGDSGTTFKRPAYVFDFNGVVKWVSECFTSDHCSVTVVSRRDTEVRGDRFVEYTDIEALEDNRLTLADYSNWPKENEKAKYQRGHLAAAGNHRYNFKAYYSTFCLSNIVPLFPNVNSTIGIIEAEARSIAKKYGKVYITTGPHFCSKRQPKFVSNSSKVMILDGIFKVLAYEKMDENLTYKVKAYFVENIPNETGVNRKTKIELKELKRMTGLMFFSNISEDVLIENIKSKHKIVLKDEWFPNENIPACINIQFDEVENYNADDDDRPIQRRSRYIG